MSGLAQRVREYFQAVYDDVFADDPATNPSLRVEVIGDATAFDTPIVVLIAPWTLCGIALPPDGRLPSTLRVGHKHYPVLANEVEQIGRYQSVILVPNVSAYTSQKEAQEAARPLAEAFRAAVKKARQEMAEVRDRDLRALFTTGRIEPTGHSATGFGSPDEDPSESLAL